MGKIMTTDDILRQEWMDAEMKRALKELEAEIRKDLNEVPITLSDGTVIKRGDSIWRLD